MERPHWDYYLTIVEDLGKTGRFVEFSEANFSAIKFVRVILSVGSEIDVVAKLLCAKIKPKEKPQNIDEYREIIVAKHSRISTIKIAAPKYRLTFTPWQDWGSGRNPGWWKVYNKVKHQREAIGPSLSYSE